MESSIAVFLLRQIACELLPTYVFLQFQEQWDCSCTTAGLFAQPFLAQVGKFPLLELFIMGGINFGICPPPRIWNFGFGLPTSGFWVWAAHFKI